MLYSVPLRKVPMRNPFRRPDPPRVTKRCEDLELRCTDIEDSIEKVLYQQSRILGKVNARHKRELKDAELQLDIEHELAPPTAQVNGLTLPTGDLKAHLRQRVAQLRGR